MPKQPLLYEADRREELIVDGATHTPATLSGQHADHPQRLILDAHRLANRRAVAEQIFGDSRAQNCDRRRSVALTVVEQDPLVGRRSCSAKLVGVVPMIVAFLSAAGATMSALPLNCGAMPFNGSPRLLIAWTSSMVRFCAAAIPPGPRLFAEPGITKIKLVPML